MDIKVKTSTITLYGMTGVVDRWRGAYAIEETLTGTHFKNSVGKACILRRGQFAISIIEDE